MERHLYTQTREARYYFDVNNVYYAEAFDAAQPPRQGEMFEAAVQSYLEDNGYTFFNAGYKTTWDAYAPTYTTKYFDIAHRDGLLDNEALRRYHRYSADMENGVHGLNTKRIDQVLVEVKKTIKDEPLAALSERQRLFSACEHVQIVHYDEHAPLVFRNALGRETLAGVRFWYNITDYVPKLTDPIPPGGLNPDAARTERLFRRNYGGRDPTWLTPRRR